jgi:hypothetical protein
VRKGSDREVNNNHRIITDDLFSGSKTVLGASKSHPVYTASYLHYVKGFEWPADGYLTCYVSLLAVFTLRGASKLSAYSTSASQGISYPHH